MTRDIIIATLLAAVLLLFGQNYLQHRTMQYLADSQRIETQRAAAQSKEIAALRREVARLHREDSLRLLKLEKQTDLMVAASRSGWRGAESLMRTRQFREEMLGY